MLAAAYEKNGLYDRVEEYLTRAAAVANPSPMFCYECARFLLAHGKAKEAYDLLKKATAADWNVAAYWYALGATCEDMLQLPAEAVPAFLRAIELEPDVAEAYYMVGKAYANLEDYGKSAHYWRTYLELSPGGRFSETTLQRTNSPPWKGAASP